MSAPVPWKYDALRTAGRVFNDLTPRPRVDSAWVSAFRESKERAVLAHPQGRKVFAWAMQDADGRGETYQKHTSKAWRQWLILKKPRHYQFNAPSDPGIQEMWERIRRLEKRTWSSLFRRYWVDELVDEAWYSLPDVYYISKQLGRVPETVLDVGGGWGRLGAAWAALGSRAVGVTDSIEQQYIMQNQFLRSIPDTPFHEALESSESTLNLKNFRGTLHFPLWDLAKIPDSSIEAVSAVQILREVHTEFLLYLFEQLRRILVDGGVFYVRDNDHDYKMAVCYHDVKITETLERTGFDVVRSDLVQGRDIHGVPRMFVRRKKEAALHV